MARLFLFLSMGALFLALVPAPAFAQAPDTSRQRSLGIAPLRAEIDIDPGTTYSGGFAVRNNGQRPLTLNFTAESFTVTNEAYDYSFNLNDEEVGWVSFSQQSVTLQPLESKEIKYLISVPLGTSAGGRYLSLFSTSVPVSNGAGIDSVERLATLLYITINGTVTRAGTLLNLNAPSVMFDTGTWSAQIRNSGSTHFRSAYRLETKSIFNESISKQEGNGLILPASVRLLGDTVPAPRFLGLYTSTYTIGLGDNPGATVEKWFLYLPPFQTVPILIILTLLTLRLIRLRHRRVKNRR